MKSQGSAEDMSCPACAENAAPEPASSEPCPACGTRTTERSEALYKDLSNRLARIEGQIRGIRRMLDENAYCIDIISQASAAASALNSFSKQLLSEHIRHCVREDVAKGREEKLDELVSTLQKLMK